MAYSLSSIRTAHLCKRICFTLALPVALLCAAPALAEIINYPQDGTPLRTLSFIPGAPDSLFPDSLSGNTITVNNGAVIPGIVFGGVAENADNVTGNRIFMQGGSVVMEITGGFNELGAATNNSIIMSGGTVSGFVIGGESLSGTASGNSVVMSGGTVAGGVTGADGYSSLASGNSVTITGGTVALFVAGAESFSGHAINNTVTLSGAPNLTTAGIYGGYDGNIAAPGEFFTGNTLNIWNYTGSSVASVRNFQYYNFLVPETLANGSTLLTVTNTADLTGSGGRSAAVNIVSTAGGSAPLQPGYTVTLIKAGTLTGTPTNTTVQGQHGISLLYDWSLATTATTLDATLTGVEVNPQTKALSEGRIAGLAFVNQGADLVAGPGMEAARRGPGSAMPDTSTPAGSGPATPSAEGEAAAAPQDDAANTVPVGITPFAVFSGGSSRYDTGSHVDLDGFSLMTGLALNANTGNGNLMLGAFFEAGWGSYDSHNSFNSLASIKGDGDTSYSGGGILGRYDFSGGFYTEASARMGWVDTDFSSDDFNHYFSNYSGSGKAEYDSGALYYGLHGGVGYIWQMDETASLDMYTKLLWTHQDSDTVRVAGDPVKFDDADSLRWRGGARISYAINQYITPHLGAAYEYEFDGEARASAYGYGFDSPDLTGGTGIGEFGLTIKPVADAGFSFDLGAQGYTGVREGVSGNMQFKYEF